MSNKADSAQFGDEEPDSKSSPQERERWLLRIAQLVATGESQMPPDLDEPELMTVLRHAGSIRRRNFFHFLARVVAMEIYRDHEGETT